MYDVKKEKAEYRQSWAKKQFSHMIQGKKYEEELTAEQVSSATMMTLGAVVVHLGGWSWEPAIRGAITLAAKCQLLGKPWVERDPFTGMVNYMVMSRKWQDVFKKRWSTFEEQWSKQGEQPQQKPAAPANSGSPSKGARGDASKRRSQHALQSAKLMVVI